MPPGYHGNYLRIDVSTGRADRVLLSDTVLRQYIGGSGLGARLLLDEAFDSLGRAHRPIRSRRRRLSSLRSVRS